MLTIHPTSGPCSGAGVRNSFLKPKISLSMPLPDPNVTCQDINFRPSLWSFTNETHDPVPLTFHFVIWGSLKSQAHCKKKRKTEKIYRYFPANTSSINFIDITLKHLAIQTKDKIKIIMQCIVPYFLQIFLECILTQY